MESKKNFFISFIIRVTTPDHKYFFEIFNYDIEYYSQFTIKELITMCFNKLYFKYRENTDLSFELEHIEMRGK